MIRTEPYIRVAQYTEYNLSISSGGVPFLVILMDPDYVCTCKIMYDCTLRRSTTRLQGGPAERPVVDTSSVADGGMDAGLGAQGRGVDCGISSPILNGVLDDKYASGRVTDGLPPVM